MATIGNYRAALGDTLKQTAGGIVKGFGYGLKGAALSEMPGLVAATGAFSALSKKANSIEQAKAALAQEPSKTPVETPVVSSPLGGNPFPHMIHLLAQINANTATAANVASASAQAEKYKMMFDEEKAREQAQQNQALIDAIKNSGMGGGPKAGADAAAGAGGGLGGLLSNILGNALGGMLGTVVMGALLGIKNKLKAFIAELVLSAALLFGGPGGTLGKIGGVLGTGARIAGKIGSRFIPYVGWALLAADVAEAGSSLIDLGEKSWKKNAKKNANKPPNAPMEYDAMGNATGVGPDTSENTKGNANSPKSETAQTGANKTSGLLWRVPLTVPYRVSSEFGEKSSLRSAKHDGIDLAVGMGNYVVAAADGILVQVSENKTAGTFAIVDHRNGMTSAYCHLSAGLTQKVGQNVKIGDVIGFVGSTGHSTGPHLHFSLKRGGSPVNPRTFIKFGEANKETTPEAPAKAPSGAPQGDAKRGNFDPTKAQRVPGFAAQANKKLTDNAVTAYYKALKEGKTEEEAKAIATKVAGENPEAKAALEKVSATAKSIEIKPVTPVVADDTSAVKTSTTPLIEMGDASVAESMQDKTPVWVESYLRKVSAKGYYTERETNKRTQEVLKELGGIKENTRLTANEVKSNRITMSKGKFKTPEDILARTNKTFTDSLQRQLTKTISGTLMNALYPGGYKNVSQRTASGQLYRGEQLNKMLGLTPALTKLGTSIFGKQYGPAFGQIFSKAATGYMEVGARSVAQGIFGSMGMNSDQANILGGQILGNLAKGTQQGKLTALEQIIYGVSGGQVALGPETIFAKYGFASPQEGISYMANVLGSSMMAPIDSALGTSPLNMPNMDPRMKTMGAFGGFNGQYGGMPTGMSGPGMPSTGTLQAAAQNNPYLQLNKDGMVVIKDNMPEQTKTIAEQLNVAKQSEIDSRQRFLDAEKGSEERAIAQKMVSESQYEQQILTNRLLESRATTGSGTNISIGGGGGSGGFFSGGGPLAEVGNMALDLGKSAVTSKIVQSLGIKNPYMGMLASFAVNKGLSYVGGKAFDLFKGTEIGQSFSGGLSSLQNSYQMAAPSWAGGYTEGQKAYFNAIDAADADLGAAMTGGEVVKKGAESATSLLPGFEFISEALPYAGAVIKLFKGDIAGAATTAAGVYIGQAIGNMILPGIGGIVGGFLGGFVGGLFGGGGSSPPQPNPQIWRIIRVRGNNNIGAITDLQAPREATPQGWVDFADSMIRVGFNAAKEAEVQTKEQSPFDFIMCTIDKNNVTISLRTGDPTSSGNDLALGAPGKDFSAGKAASQIVKHVADAFKTAYAAKTDAIDKASKILNSKTYGTVSKGLIKELSTGTNKIDVTKEQGVFGATPAQDALILEGRAHTPQAAVGADEYNAATPPMIWSAKEGKYVEAPFTEKMVSVTDDTGFTTQVKQKVYDANALMIDKNGKVIYDTNNNGIDLADIVTPTLSTTSGTITGGTSVAATTGTTGTTGNVNVVTNADNSQTNNQSVNTYYTSLLSKSRNAIRDADVNTALPA